MLLPRPNAENPRCWVDGWCGGAYNNITQCLIITWQWTMPVSLTQKETHNITFIFIQHESTHAGNNDTESYLGTHSFRIP